MNKKPDPQIAPQAGSITYIINSCTVYAHIALLLDLKTAVPTDELATFIQSAIIMTRLPGIQVTPDTPPLPDDPAIIPDTDS